MPRPEEQLEDGDLLAAVDIGSNSFHMVVARYVLGQLRIVDRLREMVRLAAGLDAHGGLDPAATARAIECLARFGERLRCVPPHRIRAIATNTLRAMRSPRSFLLPAETALGHGIEVVAGREEARLIYLGVAQGQPPTDQKRLVVDIGGGSTEFIIGAGFEALERESLQMGCVASTARFFANGKLGRKRWREGVIEVSAEFQQFGAAYRARGWQEAIGSSGTIKAIGEMHRRAKLSEGAITRDGIAALRDTLLTFDDVSQIRLPGLSEERRPVIAGGLLVLEAAFNELGLESMDVSETAMREGILHDMLGRAQRRDARESSIAALAQRYGVDTEHGIRVADTALDFFSQAADSWDLGEPHRLMLSWAARIHELGMSIAHSQYHHHGAYVIANSDIAGFSTQEQHVLAAMLRCQRRSLSMATINDLPERWIEPTLRCVLLLRIAILLHRGHAPLPLPPVSLLAGARQLKLSIPRTWLDGHPLTATDLDAEREYLANIGHTLIVQAG